MTNDALLLNTSATGGLVPPTPATDDAVLDRVFQTVISGLTGLPGSLVRQAWQQTPPIPPPPTVDWVSLGIVRVAADAHPAVMHDPAGQGHDVVWRHEVLDLLCRFHGPHAPSLARCLRDGLVVAQNRETLAASGIVVVSASEATAAHVQEERLWLRRMDMTLTFRREVRVRCPILNLLSAPITVLDGDSLPSLEIHHDA